VDSFAGTLLTAEERRRVGVNDNPVLLASFDGRCICTFQKLESIEAVLRQLLHGLVQEPPLARVVVAVMVVVVEVAATGAVARQESLPP